MGERKKYAVTFCAMDQEAGSNPLWHSLLLLSELDVNSRKMRVVDHFGYYGVPSTQRNSWLSQFKIKLGLDIDFNGNHGILRSEELRFLDLGKGLHGVTFELSKEKFEALQKKCRDMINAQEKAIKEKIKPLHLSDKPSQKTRLYPYEHLSPHIYALEKAQAHDNQTEPRLKPFQVNFSFQLNPFMGLWGPSLKGSYTCKTQALNLLKGILTQQQIDRLSENGKHPNIPRYSGKMEKILLHSTGPLRKHTKRSGEMVCYRDWNDPDVELYWTIPPQEYEILSSETGSLFKLSEEYCDEAKAVASKLQCLEWLFINAQFPQSFQQYQRDLINYIHTCYESFSIIAPKKAKTKITGWKGYALSLLSLPRDEDEKDLLEKIKQGKNLLNSLYIAVVDNWEIDENCPFENERTQNNNVFDMSSSDEEEYYNPLEALAAYLGIEDKKKLCSIVGRSYLEPEEQKEKDDNLVPH